PVPELARQVADVEAIIPMGAHPIPEAVLAAAPRLRIVAGAAVGYNIVDVAAAAPRRDLVAHTPGGVAGKTAGTAPAPLARGAARSGERPFRPRRKMDGRLLEPADGRRRPRRDAGDHRAGSHRPGHRPTRRGLWHARPVPQPEARSGGRAERGRGVPFEARVAP